MQWDDDGYLLNRNRYGENSAIIEFYTSVHGKVSGLLYGATSKKIKNYLLVGNKFHISFKSKNENQLGYFKIEINEITTPHYLDNPKKPNICNGLVKYFLKNNNVIKSKKP